MNRQLASLTLLAALAFIAIAVGVDLLAIRTCRATSEADVARLQVLEAEIDFRQRALLTLLEKARNKSDLNKGELILSARSPYREPQARGVEFLELKENYSRLRDRVAVQNSDAQMQPKPRSWVTVDDWLVRTYPVDQAGFLYSSSSEQLNSLRLAARQLLEEFRAQRLFTGFGAKQAVPVCGAWQALPFLFGDGEVVVRTPSEPRQPS